MTRIPSVPILMAHTLVNVISVTLEMGTVAASVRPTKTKATVKCNKKQSSTP